MNPANLLDARPHPAAFTKVIVAKIESHLFMTGQVRSGKRLLDPFAGTGKIHDNYTRLGIDSVGVELEPEWAMCHDRNIVGSALALPFPDATFDLIVTSPCYGNRMADHHNALDSSRRITYKHKLGRDLSADSSAVMQWGQEYRDFHTAAWGEVARVAKPGATFILNISDHVRKHEVVPVSAWHVKAILTAGFAMGEDPAVERIDTPRMRFGQNHTVRCPYEYLITFTKK